MRKAGWDADVIGGVIFEEVVEEGGDFRELPMGLIYN